MDVVSEEINDRHNTMNIKAKRTKRLRPPSPCTTGGGWSRQSCSEGGGKDEANTHSSEDKDMANCLILLAQGKQQDFYLHECTTCNKTFSSFQALGGHRTSHKRHNKNSIFTKSHDHQDKEKEFGDDSNHHYTAKMESFLKKTLISAKIHECSICGSEFSSGQALGGHMRRHRKVSIINDQILVDLEKPRHVLPLDLNFPPVPEDDHREMKFQCVGNQGFLVFSAPDLVDSHYLLSSI